MKLHDKFRMRGAALLHRALRGRRTGTFGGDKSPRAIRNEDLHYEDITGGAGTPIESPPSVPLRSGLCRQADFVRDGYRYWIAALKEQPRFHRKQWEFYYIVQALYERGLLESGKRALGFGVGREPLPALFASRGVEVLASDQGLEDAVRAGWAETHQHATDLAHINDRGICAEDAFYKRVSFREIDMNQIPDDLAGQFDCCWSACSLEHLGSIQHGIDFVVASVDVLRPGGVAIHTTEFNLTSNEATLESPGLSLFRRRDIEALVRRLEEAGHSTAPIDWSAGRGLVDSYVDLPPYKAEPHLKLQIGAYDCTSIGLIITRAR